ncbi:MAG: hypothetical protein JO322_02825 [Candidatus Eremiobacteraeota bacterium]|nr:hypothetical protein [Candidatus Eremiobacteraeota bacterium]
MKDRNELTRDGEPLVDRGIIDDEDDDRELPVDETDDGPEPVIIIKDDDEPRDPSG